MAASRYSTNDMRRQIGSPRSKGRDNSDTPCRNITIYGSCKYREAGCSFKHDLHTKPTSQPDFSAKKPLNVDSPAFTPSSTTQQLGGGKKSTLPSQAAIAAPFTPRGTNKLAASSMPKNGPESSALTATSRDFTPSNYDVAIGANNGTQDNSSNTTYGGDPFVNRMGGNVSASSYQHNPYAAADQNQLFVPPPPPGSLPAGVAPPPNYHLYQPFEPYKGSLQPHQRSTYDFFMPQAMREDIQKKLYATQLVVPSTALPNIGEWYTLSPLDTSNKKNPTSFGYPSWLYKAYNARVAHYFALRRLEGFGLSSQLPLQKMNEWRKIRHPHIVSLHEAFTTRNFNDNSLVFVYDYYPCSKTLQEHYFPAGRYKSVVVSEDVLWSYISQITAALKMIHSHNLAARCIELSKIIVDNSRIRLAACGILDVTRFGLDNKPMQQLQQEDLFKFGSVMFALASGGTIPLPNDAAKARDLLNPKLSEKLKDTIVWLISPPRSLSEPKTLEEFASTIALQLCDYIQTAGLDNDEKGRILKMEVENGRIARLTMKLNAVLERGDLGLVKDWSEVGERYHLKLFRDYVFHRVDADGNPDLSIGHMISCLNKLDAGTEEHIQLITRDSETLIITTYREVRALLNRAFNELVKHSKNGAPGSQ
ncbi:PAB-dependent poly(A)-specific ribonuclease subunit PAN3 [Podospora fimiseda]|uniref:PAN2-PAN3 deadenylation complex subunit PAN3 n=1 Tax=Podospora fimiseda TaxID=252190 RepID=A0AAN6YTB5_9PEZI|nr:PAB-dependent poly(A)-specific ribonuclease subunit PAN3 [Podospora fimiseda]